MEGREAKHIAIATYARDTTYQHRWEQIFLHKCISLICLWKKGYCTNTISRFKLSDVSKCVKKMTNVIVPNAGSVVTLCAIKSRLCSLRIIKSYILSVSLLCVPTFVRKFIVNIIELSWSLIGEWIFQKPTA